MATLEQKPQPPNVPYPDIDPEFRVQLNEIYHSWLQNTRDFATAKQNFADLLAEVEQSGNIIHQAGVYNMMGVMNGYRSNYDESTRYFEQARELYEQAGAIPRVASCDLNLGESYRLRGNFTRARAYFHRAYEAGKTLNQVRTQVIACTNEGQMWLSLKSIEKARMTLQEALELAVQPWANPETEAEERDRSDNICEIHHALVETCLADGNPYQAWQHAKESLNYAEKTARPNRLGYANRALGAVLTELDEPLEEGFSNDPDVYFKKALDFFRQVKLESEVGKTLFAQARSYAKRGKRRSAGQLFQQAMVIFTKLGMTDDAARAAEEQLLLI
jgi:tetratricopeptide (TPR) repeat protein